MLRSERFQRLSKEAFWIIAGQAMAVLGLLAGVRLLTELLDPVAYGELALGMTVATLVSQTLIGPLASGASRFYAPAMERNDLGGYLIAVRRLVAQVVGVIAILMIGASIGLSLMGEAHWNALAVTALLFAIVSGSSSLMSGVQNAARQRSIVALHQGMDSWLRWLVAAGLMIWLGASAVVAMAGYAAAAAIVLGSQYWFFRKTTPDRPVTGRATDWEREIWSYSWPFAAWGIFTWAQLVSDRWALGIFTTPQEVGLYAALFQLGYYPIATATGMIVQFLAPIFFERVGDGSDSQRNANVSELSARLSGLALIVTGTLFMVTLFFHKPLFSAFVADEYRSVSQLLPWVVLGGGLFATGQTIALNLMSQLKTRTMIAAKIVTAIMGVAFSVVGAYVSGIAGVVGAGVLFALMYALWMADLARKQGRPLRHA